MIDGVDRRIAKKVNGEIVARYIWQDQLKLVAEMNPNGSIKKQFVYAEGVNSPEYMVFEGKRYLFVKDHRGSVEMVVDVNSGEVKQRIKYSEFGEVLQDTNPGFQPFGFAGGLYDPDTKLVRFGARDYDGRIGRWLSKDPIRFNGGDPNLYGYVLNDPVNLVDVKGTWPEWLDDGVCYITGRCDHTDVDSPDWEDTLGDVIDDIHPGDKKNDSKEPKGQISCNISK